MKCRQNFLFLISTSHVEGCETEIVLIIMEIYARKTVTASTIWTPISVFLEESRRHLIFHKVLYDFNAITTGYRATVS